MAFFNVNIGIAVKIIDSKKQLKSVRVGYFIYEYNMCN